MPGVYRCTKRAIADVLRIPVDYSRRVGRTRDNDYQDVAGPRDFWRTLMPLLRLLEPYPFLFRWLPVTRQT